MAINSASIGSAAGSNSGNVAVNTPVTTSAGEGGLLNQKKDAKEAQTAAQFGEVLNKIQAQYGGKAEKPREVKKTLGKDDFLRIMITQMQHQDPTNPFKAEQMATEMAQFTSVEQMTNINQNIQKLANQNTPMERLAMTGLIGKTVTIDRDRFPHKEGDKEALSYNLPKNANSVKVALVSEAGEVVLEKEIGAQKAGEQSFSWDGAKANTLPAKGGSYMLRVEAKDERDQMMQMNSQRQARVVGVSFEGTDPVLLIGDARSQEKVTMKNVVRIDGDAPPSNSGMAAAPQSSFFSFKKGEGSGPAMQGAPPSLEAPAQAQVQLQQQQQQQPNLQEQAQAPKTQIKEASEDDTDQAVAKAREQARAAYAEAIANEAAAKRASLAQTGPAQAGQLAGAGGGAGNDKGGFPNGLHE